MFVRGWAAATEILKAGRDASVGSELLGTIQYHMAVSNNALPPRRRALHWSCASDSDLSVFATRLPADAPAAISAEAPICAQRTVRISGAATSALAVQSAARATALTVTPRR